MDRIWSPWRSQYIATFKKPKKKRKKGESLFTAAYKAGNDRKHMIVWRGEYCFLIMNRYPYNSGHLMVVPYRQISDFQSLTSEELVEMMEAVQRSMKVLNDLMHPHGFNLGANIGRVSGAGVDDHVHFHIVPRWNGDTNFMPVLADTKVVSEEMEQTYRALKKAFSGKKSG